MSVPVAIVDGAEIEAACVREGLPIAVRLPAAALKDAAARLAGTAVAVLLVPPVRARALPDALVRACDRAGVRIVVVGPPDRAARTARAHGLAWADPARAWSLREAIEGVPATDASPAPAGSILTVWGPAGAPGRTGVASLIAAELARGPGRVALVDADTEAPALALFTGLPDEGPGFAAACRRAAEGTLDAHELDRIAQSRPVPGGTVEVLCGINRPSRWPELAPERVAAALGAMRAWAEHTVVDVASSLESDEAIVSDLDGPRRHGATLAALEVADVAVAVLRADPVGLSRGVRALAELRAIRGARPLLVVVNQLRPGPLGVDPAAQVGAVLRRYADVEDPILLPHDQRAFDAALLHGRPIAEVAGRSAIVGAVRRAVGGALLPFLAGPAERPADADAGGDGAGARRGAGRVPA